ncbi:MAG: polyprenyl diphosphate synthase [Patescibacteria group bacterium]|nr:polyprenyl diphosphate synthase [Patescibacteria group bacterium]
MNQLPYHLGIILDGNRRWAEERGLPVFEGHRKGLEKVQRIIEYCKEKGIKILTLFVFSTENWKRGKEEVNYLIKLGKKAISNHFKHLHKNKIRIRIIGQKETLPKSLQKKIIEIEKQTKDNKEMMVNFALSYGGRAEIVEAVKKIIEKKIPPKKINENTIKENLWTSDVDLIIRTGKEQRISNFLIWQAAYSELYFCPKYWPDFSEKDLDLALAEYSRRQRRFGQ